MNPLKTIIAYNSTTAKETLEKFLDSIPEIEVLEKTSNGNELVKLTNILHPNILFIDTELNELNGIEAARSIRAFNPTVIIIFLSPSDKYIKDAFDIYAYDYIIKPIKYSRIHQSIYRIIQSGIFEQADLAHANAVRDTKYNSKILIENDGKSTLINVKEIIFITRYERKIVIYYRTGKVSLWKSIEDIKKVLSDNFFSSHKGYIINVHYIKELIPLGRKTFQVIFYGSNETALMTIEKAKRFREKYCVKV